MAIDANSAPALTSSPPVGDRRFEVLIPGMWVNGIHFAQGDVVMEETLDSYVDQLLVAKAIEEVDYELRLLQRVDPEE